MKKAQITVFVLLAIVILAILSFFMYLILASIESDIQQRDNLEEYVDTERIDFEINSCFDANYQEAKENLSRQGGVLYKDQDGLVQRGNQPTLEYTNDGEPYDVTYGIRFEEVCPDQQFGNFTDPPQYPLPRTDITQLEQIYEDRVKDDTDCNLLITKKSGFFGKHTMNKLGYLNGCYQQSSDFLSTNPCRENYAVDKNDSVEGNLREYAQQNILSCIEGERFEDDQGNGLTPLTQQADFNFIVSPRKTLIEMELPFNISVNDQDVTVDYTFEYDPEDNFVELYQFTDEVLMKEMKDYSFNATQDQTGYATLDTNIDGRFDVERERDSETNNSLLIIEDTWEGYEYVTAIEKRPPVLDYINDEEEWDVEKITLQNQTLQFEPFGADPDDTTVEYGYDGFGETSSYTLERYNPTNPSDCYKYDHPIDNQTIIEQGIPNNCTDTFNTINFNNELTTSTPFQNTGRIANMSLSRNRAGSRTTTVQVKDQLGLQDYQNVNTVIVDFPYTVARNRSYKKSFSHEIIQERPLVIDATDSIPSLIGGNNLWFEVNISFGTGAYQGETLSYTTDKKTFNLTGEAYNQKPTLTYPFIEDIHERITPQTSFNITAVGTSEFTNNRVLKGQTLQFNIDSVKQCEEATGVTQQPYPYGDKTNFLSSGCCSGDTVQDADTICWEKTFTINNTANSLTPGMSNAQITNWVEGRADLEQYPSIPTTPSFSTKRTEKECGSASDQLPCTKNQVGKVEIQRQCDGTRGNICTGDINITIYRHPAFT